MNHNPQIPSSSNRACLPQSSDQNISASRLAIVFSVAIAMLFLGVIAIAGLNQGTPWQYDWIVASDVDGMATIDSSLFAISFKGQSFQEHTHRMEYLTDGCYYNHPLVKFLKNYQPVWNLLEPSNIQIGYDQNTRCFLVKSESEVIASLYRRSELLIGKNIYSLSEGKRCFVVHVSGMVEEIAGTTTE